MTGGLSIHAPDGVPEIASGDDLAALLTPLLDLDDGDIVALTSKIVAKAEGRVQVGDRAQAIAAETTRVVARRGETVIARTRHGLTLAAAGVDTSNVPAGHVVLLPVDSDASARSFRRAVHERLGVNVGVLVTDTAGRPWRHGQTDIAIGAAGLVVSQSFAGHTDRHGNQLAVTEPAVADELAGAAELAQGKLGERPCAVLRGRPDLVLPPGDHGVGAAALIRAEDEDLFGFGAREAVLRALAGAAQDQSGFGAPAPFGEMVAAARTVFGRDAVEAASSDGVSRMWVRGAADRVGPLAFAHGWTVVDSDSGGRLRLGPITP